MDGGSESGTTNTRKFLCVTDFDRLQYYKRPKRPTWIKSFVRDLDLAVYIDLSLTNRGFLCDFIKLAASMSNRVPSDARLIAHRLNTRPQVAGKAIRTLMSLGFVSEFVEDLKTCKDNDLEHIRDAAGSPKETASLSNSPSDSQSPCTELESQDYFDSRMTNGVCPKCDGEGCHWCPSAPQRDGGANTL